MSESLLWEAERRFMHDAAFKALATEALNAVDRDAHAHGQPLAVRDRQLVMSGIAVGLLQAERGPSTS